jgi:hypothetical protein
MAEQRQAEDQLDDIASHHEIQPGCVQTPYDE